MYEEFYGLRERPFELAPDPRFLLLTKQHDEALGNLEYGISARKGITVLIGEAGTGKTTLIRAACRRARMEARSSSPRWAVMTNPRLNQTEFVEFLAESFGLSQVALRSKTRCLAELEALLLRGASVALIVDEAQSVPLDLLEEIRLLVNIGSNDGAILPVVLVGQPELAERLNDPALRQLKQRIALRCSLSTLKLSESARYIAGRIRTAGGDPARLFSLEAVKAIHLRAHGIPRLISVICDNALLTGCAEEQRTITAATIERVCRDFDLPETASGHALEMPDARTEPVVSLKANTAPTVSWPQRDVKRRVGAG
jgi:general secretion pathway protein A